MCADRRASVFNSPFLVSDVPLLMGTSELSRAIEDAAACLARTNKKPLRDRLDRLTKDLVLDLQGLGWQHTSARTSLVSPEDVSQDARDAEKMWRAQAATLAAGLQSRFEWLRHRARPLHEPPGLEAAAAAPGPMSDPSAHKYVPSASTRQTPWERMTSMRSLSVRWPATVWRHGAWSWLRSSHQRWSRTGDPSPATSWDRWSDPTLRIEFILGRLWATGRGVVSYDSGLVAHELCDINPMMVHLTIPTRYRINRAGRDRYAIHHADLGADEITQLVAVTVTTIRRTLHDTLHTVPAYLARQAITTAGQRGAITSSEHDALVSQLIGGAVS